MMACARGNLGVYGEFGSGVRIYQGLMMRGEAMRRKGSRAALCWLLLAFLVCGIVW